MEEYKIEITADGKVRLKKRFKFKCWKCGKVYSIFKEADLKQRLRVECSYCHVKADVDFRPYEEQVKEPLRSDQQNTGVVFGKFNLPTILPTNKLEK